MCAPCQMHLPLTGYEQKAEDNPMARLFWGQFPIERAAALFFYEPQSEASRLIYEMKYNGRPEIGERLGVIMARQILGTGFFDGVDAIVPMPITRKRLWQRGYNQSQKIAEGIKTITSLPIYNNVVRRMSFKKSQTSESRWERMENVEGAFRLVRPELISGRHILLVDDIVTTGATIISCGRELAKADGVRISVLSLGRTK